MNTVFSGIQPSGTLHIGNYLGAIKQWLELAKSHQTFFCIVDLHAITVPYDEKKLPDNILDTAALYLAAGLDPDKSTIFVQSNVPAHAELAWLLGTQTPFGELSRMTQFKEKSAKQKDTAVLGLFAYPVLQAADILLYQTNIVPVGEDQKQHIELTRDIAKRFNNKFGVVFTIPQAQINKSTARIMSLTDPTKKMSKADEPKSYIALTDKPDTIRKKISSAVTETNLPAEALAKAGPGVRNLFTIYQAFSGEEESSIEQKFAGAGYKEFKEALAELIIAELKPLQEKFTEIRADEAMLGITLGKGKEKAAQVAAQTLQKVKTQMGLA